MAARRIHQGDTILLYSADMEGHREVYCRVIADFLLERGCAVVIAGNLRSRDGSVYTRLEPLSAHPRVRFVDTSLEPPRGPVLDLDSLSRLMRSCEARAVILTEADADLGLLIDQLWSRKKRLPGRRVGIFLRSTNYIHSGQRRSSLRGRLSEDGSLRRHGEETLDCSTSTCCRASDSSTLPFAWTRYSLPKGVGPTRGFRTSFVPTKNLRAMAPILRANGWCAWTSSPASGLIVRSWSTTARRDDAAAMTQSFVSPTPREAVSSIADGATCRMQKKPEVRAIRDRLRRSGSLLETETTIRRFDVGARFLAASECVVLPYRTHLGSSGVMLQALEARRPVLVPDVGLMAERTVRHGLGLTYRHGDYDDLRRQYRRLRAQGPVAYQENIACFLRYFEGSRWRPPSARRSDGEPLGRGILCRA